jgi:hypothetical protein
LKLWLDKFSLRIINSSDQYPLKVVNRKKATLLLSGSLRCPISDFFVQGSCAAFGFSFAAPLFFAIAAFFLEKLAIGANVLENGTYDS